MTNAAARAALRRRRSLPTNVQAAATRLNALRRAGRLPARDRGLATALNRIASATGAG